MRVQVIADTEFGHTAIEHFFLDVRKSRTCGITGMLRMDMQILSDFHNS
jgi:hypothetical protein